VGIPKICHITTAHPFFDTRIFHKEAKTLAKTGYDVALIAQYTKDEIIDGIKIISLPKPKNRFERFLKLDYLAYIKALQEKADIYHFHDPSFMIWAVILKVLGKKVIYDVHEDYAKQTFSKEYIPKKLRKIIAFIVKVVENIFSRFFDGIITATDDILQNFAYHKAAVSIKNYPIATCFINVEQGSVKDADVCRLIYIGGLSKTRGITKLIQSLEYFNSKQSINLILCGKFNPCNYELEIKSMEKFKNVEYLGLVSPDKLPELISKANIGMVCLYPIPNYLTALPTKLFEYMAAGLPVIASNFFLWKKIVEDNKCGICVDPLDPKTIAKAIKYLIDYPDEAKRMGENGRKAVLEKYNWEYESKKLVQFYKKLPFRTCYNKAILNRNNMLQ
jgi:glycosyltransferase involved in cell wall biosynthesis